MKNADLHGMGWLDNQAKGNGIAGLAAGQVEVLKFTWSVQALRFRRKTGHKGCPDARSLKLLDSTRLFASVHVIKEN